MDPCCASLAALAGDIRACRVCRDAPRYGAPLPHEPRPVFQVSTSARLCIAGQAPGVRVHASGRPYTDPSGVRLRSWLGIKEEIFYDPQTVAIVPMGFCFPGLDGKGGDLPPRRECAELWRERLFERLPSLELILLVGQYALKWHLDARTVAQGLSETVGRWREVYRLDDVRA
jgi:uracil-DNA glycosylase